MESIVIEMPYEPLVSSNSCYGYKKGRVFLKSKARKWKDLFIEKFTEELGEDWIGEDTICLGLNARFPLKRGQKPDATNFTKLPLDSIAEALGVDDHNFRISEVRGSHLKENGSGLLLFTVSNYGREE